MLVLGIETSCDETGVALYDDSRGLLGHVLHTQARLHADYGGEGPGPALPHPAPAPAAVTPGPP